MSYPYTITNDNVSIVVDGETLTVRRGASNFEAARNAVLAEDWSDIKTIFSQVLHIEKWLRHQFTFVNGRITFYGDPMDESLSARLIAMAEAGGSPEPWLDFWQRLQSNPSMRSVSQLPKFLQNKGIPIDNAGYILAYKAVQHDYLDYHSSTVANTVGSEHSMPRNKISDDPNHACHEGFHVGALEYAQTFGGPDRRILICQVDPADVVCVPYDCSMQKMRVCAYKVLSEPKVVQHMSDIYEPSIEPPSPEFDGDVENVALDLLAMTLHELRAYARSIGVKGANSIPGGKTALLAAVQSYRKG